MKCLLVVVVKTTFLQYQIAKESSQVPPVNATNTRSQFQVVLLRINFPSEGCENSFLTISDGSSMLQHSK